MESPNNPLQYLKLSQFLLSDHSTAADGPVPVSPYLMSEFHFDTYDVRSQTKLTGMLFASFPLLALDDESLWTRDMLLVVDKARLVPLPADGLSFQVNGPLPDEEMLQRLKEKLLIGFLRHCEIRIFVHPESKRYSQLHLVYLQEDPSLDFLATKHRRLLLDAEEALTKLFFRPGEFPPAPVATSGPMPYDEVEYSVRSLLEEAYRAMTEWNAAIDRSVSHIEPYAIRPQFANARIHHPAVLWVAQAGPAPV